MSNRIPTQNENEYDGDAKTLEWSEAVAELQVNGISIDEIKKMTQYQLFMALRKLSEKRKDAYKRAGWTFTEKKDKQYINAGNASQIKDMINSAIRGR